MAKLTQEDILKLAKLARLRLSDTEIAKFQEEIGAILGYVEKLNGVNTEGIVPTSHAVPMENSFREDITKPSIGLDKALANAHDRSGSFFAVPKVIE